MLASQFLHKGDCLPLVHDELLIPSCREVLELLPVLLLDLYFFACMLIYKRDFEASFCLLSDFYDLSELVFSRAKVTVSLVFNALGVQSLTKQVKIK